MNISKEGLYLINKPRGRSSFSIVAQVRRVSGIKKVGHAGTLDPMATGVLIIGVERATRLLGHLMLTDKTYTATIRLGIATHTDDAEGEVLAIADASRVTDAAVHSGVATLTGEIMQRPSSVSAIKVDGVRSYDRVRSGQEVVLDERPATVSRFDIKQIRRGEQIIDLDVIVDCSAGTYIRALARDLGASLGVGGHLTALRRTRVGAFTIEQALTLDELEEKRIGGGEVIMPLAQVVAATFPVVAVDAATATQVLRGIRIPVEPGAQIPGGGVVGLFTSDGRVLSIAEPRDGVYAHLVVFS